MLGARKDGSTWIGWRLWGSRRYLGWLRISGWGHGIDDEPGFSNSNLLFCLIFFCSRYCAGHWGCRPGGWSLASGSTQSNGVGGGLAIRVSMNAGRDCKMVLQGDTGQTNWASRKTLWGGGNPSRALRDRQRKVGERGQSRQQKQRNKHWKYVKLQGWPEDSARGWDCKAVHHLPTFLQGCQEAPVS